MIPAIIATAGMVQNAQTHTLELAGFDKTILLITTS
jgi:hypothetical protein